MVRGQEIEDRQRGWDGVDGVHAVDGEYGGGKGGARGVRDSVCFVVS
jgi:hypothetical protein